ncbi:MAG: bifunctional methylenetetrahydrofolate dehydrogenase/methenyltetrahydrofolate cyclohydrolase FolD [Planctomycetes bacterium]|nr:bifunctional methylenetetrahydrofolate dehydrogenase/methenyltetrahydrofolate cyclohydrolase FolD [Planctomycetota bacterium]
MTASIIDGKAIAQAIRDEIAGGAARLKAASGVVPGLAAVLVGDNPASHVYVRNKRQACDKAGMASWLHQMPGDIAQAELVALVRKLNADPLVHGILVQLPLPGHLDAAAVLDAIDPAKDVDGLHPDNLGLLADGRPRYLPCTPQGVWELGRRSGIDWSGKRVAILGRSSIVGKSLALVLLQKGVDATVTICHSKSKNIPGILRQAEIVVAALGQPRWVTADMIHPGAVVIDVGIHRLPDGSLCGDVAYDEVAKVAGAITPVPGGVGPMTIAMLLANTLRSAGGAP